MRLSPNQQGTDRKDDYETNVWSQQSADVQLMCLYILCHNIEPVLPSINIAIK